MRSFFGQNMVVYTTDGAWNAATVEAGTLPGDEVYTVVDFGPGNDHEAAFQLQKKFNSPHQSPPFCSEYYTGKWGRWRVAAAVCQKSWPVASQKID